MGVAPLSRAASRDAAPPDLHREDHPVGERLSAAEPPDRPDLRSAAVGVTELRPELQLDFGQFGNKRARSPLGRDHYAHSIFTTHSFGDGFLTLHAFLVLHAGG